MRAKNIVKKSDSMELLREITKDVSDFSIISDMPEVKFVPTLFTSFNRATGIGGQPLGRITVVHGPYQVGKSVLALEIAESLRRKGHVSIVFDSEVAGEKEWYSSITPKSGYKLIGSLDDMRDDINSMMKRLAAKKEKGLVSDDVGCCFVVDTITKLLPRNILDKIEKEGIDKMYPIQSLWISVWSKELVPLLNRHNSALVVVLQERTKIGAGAYEKQYNVTGGNSIQYDNSLRIRVSHSEKVKKGDKVVGMQCFYKVENNKIDGTSFEEGSYFTSNGKGGLKKGLDLVREMLAECKYRGIAEKKPKKGIVFDFGEQEKPIEIDGDWAKAREYFQTNKDEFKRVVQILNNSVIRK